MFAKVYIYSPDFLQIWSVDLVFILFHYKTYLIQHLINQQFQHWIIY